MATPAQISANRENAQKSTGPRTEEGKARSSKNATKHGFNSKEFIVGDDRQEEFASLSESLRQQVSPEGALEEEVFTQLPGLASVKEIHRSKRSQKHSFPGLYAGGPDVSRLPPVTPEEAELFAMGLGAAGNQQMGSFSG